MIVGSFEIYKVGILLCKFVMLEDIVYLVMFLFFE